MTELSECPVCGSILLRHEPENDEQYQCWDFFCGGSIILGPGNRFEVNDECRDSRPMAGAVARMNRSRLTAGER